MIPWDKVHFDVALNCAWLLLGMVALATTMGAVRRGSSKAGAFSASLQLVGVASVVLALFPYISATDDVLRIANAVPPGKQTQSGPRAPGADLVRLFETADAPLVSEICTLTVIFVFICLIAVPVKTVVLRSAPFQSGRSPPAGLVLA